MKRFAVLLALAALLAGCASIQPGGAELPTLTVMVLGGSSQDALARISDAVSEITREKIGCTIQFEQSGRGEYEAALNEKALGDELPDVFAMPNQETLLQFVRNGKCRNLEAYLRGDSAWETLIDEENWKTAEIDGLRYAIPFNNDRTHCYGFLMRGDICKALGADVQQITDLNALHELLVQVKEAYPQLYPIVPQYNELTMSPAWDDMGDGLGVLVYRDGGVSDAIELSVATPEFYAWCSAMYQWNREGLVMPDASFNTEPRLALFASGQAFGAFCNLTAYSVGDHAFHLGEEIVAVRLSGYRDDCNESRQSFCVSQNSQYPELCMDFLKLLYQDEDVLNLCIYGQEGIDHTMSPEGVIQPAPEGEVAQYTIAGYCWPNRRNAAPMGGAQETGVDANEQELRSPAVGFAFDKTPVQSKMEVCLSIVERYRPGLLAGELSPDETIPIMLAQLKDAGVDDVIREKQRQYDAWRSEQLAE